MLNSQEDNSFKDKPVQIQEANSKKEISLFESKLIRDSFFRLRPLFLQDPRDHKLDPKNSREVNWFLYHPFSVEDYNHIFYFLSSLGFRLDREDKSGYHFMYRFPKEISFHVDVSKIWVGFNIKANIDFGNYQELTHNTLTSTFLSELVYYLQKVDCESQAITQTTPKPPKLDEPTAPAASTALLPRAFAIERDNNRQQKDTIRSINLKRPKFIPRFSKGKKNKLHKSKVQLRERREKSETKISAQVVIPSEEVAQEIAYTPVLDHKEIYEIIENGKKLEEERINREIQPFIKAFCEDQIEFICQEALKSNGYSVERNNLEKRIRTAYEQKVEGVTSLNKEHYTMKFEEYLKEDFDVDFNNLVRRLSKLPNKSEPGITSQLKEWIMKSKGEVIILFVIIGLILTVYSILNWMMVMPLLERFDFFNNNLWIVFLISLFIFIVVILVILFINSVRSYCKK